MIFAPSPHKQLNFPPIWEIAVNRLTALPLEFLSDEAIIAESEQMISDELQEELDELLYKNREGIITEPERVKLDKIMVLCDEGLLRKAHALKIAVERGLRPPLG